LVKADDVFEARLAEALAVPPEGDGSPSTVEVFQEYLNRIVSNLAELGRETPQKAVDRLYVAVNFARQQSDAQVQLVRELREAASARPEEDDPPENEHRAVCHAAVVAISRHLRTIKVENALSYPILELIAAFDDANLGISNPLFERAPHVPGSATMGRMDLIQKSYAAALVTILLNEMGLDQAAGYVARKSRLDAKQLTEFRKNLSRAAPYTSDNPATSKRARFRAPIEAKDLYDDTIKSFEEQKGSSTPLSAKEFVDDALKVTAK
jgi:hypothetical protein